jgi:hypothetical protein
VGHRQRRAGTGDLIAVSGLHGQTWSYHPGRDPVADSENEEAGRQDDEAPSPGLVRVVSSHWSSPQRQHWSIPTTDAGNIGFDEGPGNSVLTLRDALTTSQAPTDARVAQCSLWCSPAFMRVGEVAQPHLAGCTPFRHTTPPNFPRSPEFRWDS